MQAQKIRKRPESLALATLQPGAEQGNPSPITNGFARFGSAICPCTRKRNATAVLTSRIAGHRHLVEHSRGYRHSGGISIPAPRVSDYQGTDALAQVGKEGWRINLRI
jgi:hypothetical protein